MRFPRNTPSKSRARKSACRLGAVSEEHVGVADGHGNGHWGNGPGRSEAFSMAEGVHEKLA